MSRRKKDKRQFWTLDCETDPFKHGRVPVPFIWGLYTGTSYWEFETVDALVEFISEHDVIVYAHNGGKFDFHFLLERINLHEPVKVINGRLVVAHIGKAELRDSWNVLPIALAQYQKDQIDYAKFEADVRAKHMPEIRRYLKGDCVYLWQMIDQFEREYGRHLTQAGAALSQWRAMSDKRTPETDADYFDKFAPFYFGGRVQCFQTGHVKGPAKIVDINSAYPWAMLSSHPYGPDYVTTENSSEFRPTSFVTLECVSRGALPFRSERGAITFPDDTERRRYVVCGHELQAGLDTGTVEAVQILAVTDFSEEVSFAPYIEHFYSQRQEAKATGDKAGDIFCKLLMNSLYGKFGTNPRNYGNFQCVPFSEMEDYHGEGFEFEGMIGPHALLRAPLDDWQMKFLNVATAASITSQVRALLWRAICASEGVAYCDTDSLICQTPNVGLSNRLGDWKDEGTADDVYIAGKKLYACFGSFDDGKSKIKMASKGVRLTPDEIRRVALGETITANAEAPTFRLRGGPVFQSRNIRATG